MRLNPIKIYNNYGFLNSWKTALIIFGISTVNEDDEVLQYIDG